MSRTRTSERFLPVLALALALAAGPAAAADAPGSPAERAEALWREGATLHVEGRYASATKRFRRALEIHPSGRTHTWLAWSLSELGRKREAVYHCRRSIEVDPGYPNAYNDLGSYLLDLGRPREAERWLRRAIAFDDYCCPHYAYYHLGRALLLQGRVEAAIEALEESLARRWNYRPPRQLLMLLRLLELRVA